MAAQVTTHRAFPWSTALGVGLGTAALLSLGVVLWPKRALAGPTPQPLPQPQPQPQPQPGAAIRAGDVVVISPGGGR